MGKFVTKIALMLFMVFGMAVSVANAEELNGAQEQAKRFIEWIENFKAKYPKSYNACMNYDKDSKYFDGDICYRLLSNFTAIRFEERDGERVSIGGMNWRDFIDKYGEEETKKRLLKYGLIWQNGVSDIGIAERWAKQVERR